MKRQEATRGENLNLRISSVIEGLVNFVRARPRLRRALRIFERSAVFQRFLNCLRIEGGYRSGSSVPVITADGEQIPGEIFGWMTIAPRQLDTRGRNIAIYDGRTREWELENTPSLDVLISLYRAEPFIARHINEVKKLVFPPNMRLLYFAANESAYTHQLLSELRELLGDRILVFSSTNVPTLYSAWNHLIEFSKADYLSNWNVDDYRGPTSFIEMLEVACQVPQADVIFSDFFLTSRPDRNWLSLSNQAPVSKLRYCSEASMTIAGATPHASVFWKSSVHEDVGMFDAQMTSAGDIDFWTRSAQANKKFYFHSNPTYGYFLNPQGLSTSLTNRQNALNEIGSVRDKSEMPTTKSRGLVKIYTKMIEEFG